MKDFTFFLHYYNPFVKLYNIIKKKFKNNIMPNSFKVNLTPKYIYN